MILDFSKDIDGLNHIVMLAKISALGVSERMVGWVCSFLANRSFSVRTETSFWKNPVLNGIYRGH